jgi:hypothetical protein
VETIRENANTEGLSRTTAATYAGMRREQAEQALQMANEAADAERTIDELTLRVAYEVATMITEDGKPFYSNEDKRKAAVQSRLNDHPDYIAARVQAENRKRDAARYRIGADYYHDMLNIVLTFAEAANGKP